MNTSWVQLFNKKLLGLARSNCWNITQADDLLPEKTLPGWKWYMTSSFARFHCSSCSNEWASAKARILFNMRLQNGKGEVKVRFFKQQCRENHDEEVNFVKPVFSEENIEQVLDRLMTKIRQRCYNEKIGKGHAAFRSDDNLQGPHETSHCEACSLGLCSEAV